MSNEVESGDLSNLLKEVRESIVTITVNEFTDDSAKEFREEFLKAELTGQTVIPVYVHSSGGCVEALLSMIDLIKSSNLPVATIATGKAYSAGATLLACGTKGMRYASPTCRIMIHELGSFTMGKHTDMKSDIQENDKLSEVLFRLLDDATDEVSGYWKKKLKDGGNADLFLSASKAKKEGVVDFVKLPRIVPELTVVTKLV